uniref:Uncharacterized protein n=1 Tax=Chelonoidis abingdonii TaxID=106734 RepID=A0A8C0QLW9_CHEAB
MPLCFTINSICCKVSPSCSLFWWFILNGVAMESIARDYSHSLPKLGCIIPPYKAWRDSHAAAYFTTKPVPPLLQRTGQANGGTSGYGKMAECFQFSSAAALYLILRNKAGAGHSATLVGGHQLFLTSVKPLVGYNGTYGYRRNTPSLRRQPSLFRLVGNLPIH